MIIDATRGSIARFVNHSCEPNCRMEKWTVAGKPRMALFAGENGIMTGQELSYDYNFKSVSFTRLLPLDDTDHPNSPYSSKNVQQCRCGAENCRGILGPRPKDKDQRHKGDEKKMTKKLAGTKRKLADADEDTTIRGGQKRKKITPKSLKASVKKAMTKATTARGKAAVKKTAISSRGKTATKKGVKLPTVTTAARVKAAVRKPRKTYTAKAASASPAKKTSPLKRPSAETKKRILAAATKGSKAKAQKSPAKSVAKSPAKSPGKPGRKPGPKPGPRKAPTKSPIKARMPASKAKSTAAASSPVKVKATKGKALGASVRNTARNMVRSVKGTKT